MADGSYDILSCPQRNTGAFLRRGLRQDNSRQTLEGDVLILPSDYLNPKDWKTGEIRITENTLSIHHFGASWYTPEMMRELKRKQRRQWLRRLPSTIGWRILGKERYEKIRKKIRYCK